MLAVEWTTQFKKDLKRLKKRNYGLEELKAAWPTKDYYDCWECHIGGRNSDWLLVYKFYPSEELVVFIRTGTHADIF